MLLFCFLSKQENLYMIHHDWDLFYGIYNTILNIIKDKLFTVVDSKSFWYLFLIESTSSFITWSGWSLILISMLLLFECITCSSSLSMEEIKLFAIVNWIFYVSVFLRLFMSFKYLVILLRYSSTVSVLFLSPLLSYSI